MNLKNFLFALIIGTLTFSCGNDDENTDPCATITCPDGFIPTINGFACLCVDDGSQEGIIEVTGEVETTTWTADNIYVLSGKVVVQDGNVLTIEAGTVIKSNPGTGSLATALIIARGAKIIAEGTADAPIIMTSISDNITSGSILSPNLTDADNALWGGLIILGKAPVSVADGDTEGQIEGIPADDLFGRYGGDDAEDNSGVIQYLSVRHGGALIGADNEINGITFGGVGNGTLVENIEVVANLDDGVEFFGGTVNVKNLVVANGEDDGIDIDQNYSGTITNAFVIQSGATAGDNALEIDGPEGSTYTDGLFTINGLTIIDEDGGSDTAGDLKSKAQGTISGASWRGFTDNIKVRASFQNNCSEDKTDSYTNFINDRLVISNSEWVGTASMSDWTTVYTGSTNDDESMDCEVPAAYDSAVEGKLNAEGNTIQESPTMGADATPFANWSWSAMNSKF